MLAGFDRCRVVPFFLLLCCPMVDVGREGGKNLPLEDQRESRGRGNAHKIPDAVTSTIQIEAH